MKIVHIATELVPIAKVGGLGEVVGGLSRALSKKKHDVLVILPKYKNLDLKLLKHLKLESSNFKVFEKNRYKKNKIYSAFLNGVKIILIENEKYYERPKIYGYKDDVDRFLFLCKAALEYLNKNNSEIDILHLHDWHTCTAALLYKEIYFKKNLKIKSIVLSIHSLHYQGLCKTKNLNRLGLKGKLFLTPDKLQELRKPRTLNLLKGGLIYSDKIIPVSENYASEIKTKKGSGKLYSVIKKNKKKIKGIINGIDYNYWNMQKDPNVKYKYPLKLSKQKLIKIKNQNKQDLQKILKLNLKNTPLICSVGRLVAQKGPKLIIHAIYQALKKDGQFILLGTPFDKKTSKKFNTLKKSLKSDKNVSFNFDFNEPLSHKIFAGADFIIIPSKFEPCGLTQMIAFRYGCMPIVRHTGGLADTVFDFDDKTVSKPKKNGFSFKKFSKKGIRSALKRAFVFWNNKNDKFYSTVFKNMKLDYSWDSAAKKYIKEYKSLID